MLESFPQFSDLPAEIRVQIWQSALPPRDKASLFPWRLGCWELRPIPPSDPAYDPAAPDFPRLEFNHNRLHPLRCRASALTPLLWVSGEARHVALTWATGNGFEISREGVYSRHFDPEVDVVFLPWLMKDDDSDTTLLDTRSVFYNELFDQLQSPEALDAMRREAERRQLLKSQEQQQLTGIVNAVVDLDDMEEADYRKVDPWSAVSRFAIAARRCRSEGEWTLLPHFFPHFDTLFILPPRYEPSGDADYNKLTGSNMKMRRLFDLNPERETSYLEFNGSNELSWKGSWELDESLLYADGLASIMDYKGDMHYKKEVLDALLVLNIENCANDLASSIQRFRQNEIFRFRPVPAWWAEGS